MPEQEQPDEERSVSKVVVIITPIVDKIADIQRALRSSCSTLAWAKKKKDREAAIERLLTIAEHLGVTVGILQKAHQFDGEVLTPMLDELLEREAKEASADAGA